MTSAARVSVVIPTRERADTLTKCLRTVVDQTYDNLEIIVSDNFSSPETEAAVRGYQDSRIRYFNTGKRISMSHNFEFAISKVTGDWIIVIGDDDGLLPGGVARAVGLLQRTGAQALSSRTCYYPWPAAGGPINSILSVPMARRWEFKNAKTAIRRVMEGALGHTELPMLYTGGIVSAELYRRIRDVKGTFYQSQIPDCFSAFAVCSVIDRYIFAKEPFAVTGSSKHSTGRNFFALRKSPFFDEDNIPPHPDTALAEYGAWPPSVPATHYECYLQTQYLHGDFAKIKAADQLALALSNATAGRDAVHEWGKILAEKHHLDYATIVRRSRRIPLKRRLLLTREILLGNILARYRVDPSLGLPINDVHEASLAAATILATRPNRACSHWRFLVRTLSARRTGLAISRHSP